MQKSAPHMLLRRTAAVTAAAAAAQQIEQQQQPLLHDDREQQAHSKQTDDSPTALLHYAAEQQNLQWPTALEILRPAWTLFGPIPILFGYVGSMTMGKEAATSTSSILDNTHGFIVLACVLGCAWAAVRYYCFERESSLQGSPHFSYWLRRILAFVDVASTIGSVVCGATLFLIFCQQHPQLVRTRANGTTFSDAEGYSEHAYTLALLAACRLLASSFDSDADVSPLQRSGSSNARSSSNSTATYLWILDATLSAASPVAWICMCTAVCSRSTANGTADSTVQVYVLGSLMALMYLLASPRSAKWYGRVVESLLRVLVLCTTTYAFSVHKGSSVSSTKVEFYSLRAWGTQDSVVRTLPQIWMALVTARYVPWEFSLHFSSGNSQRYKPRISQCLATAHPAFSTRWFISLSSMLMRHLHSLGLDLDGRHAADVDDIRFSMASACLFLASYASTPSSWLGFDSGRTQSASSPSLSSSSVPALLLTVLGGPVVAMAVVLATHWLVPWLKRGVLFVRDTVAGLFSQRVH